MKTFQRKGIIRSKDRKFFDNLQNLGFLCECSGENVFLGEKNKQNFILSNLNIEITNTCNLKCKHCYGSYGKTQKPQYISYFWIEKQLNTFNKMHINSFSITGGEATCNKDFFKIVLFLLKNGFEICIFTNGLNFNTISELLKMTRQYYYTIKVSLDGFPEKHNKIRGNKNSFDLAIKTITEILTYPNIRLYISTAIMKDNIDDYTLFNSYILEKFPTAIHANDLIFPSGEAKDSVYSENDFNFFYSKAPDLFNPPKVKSKKRRCSGGISQATLMPNGKLKICNAACAEVFNFQYNVFDYGLEKAWNDCGKNIEFFRHEKGKKTNDCKKCLYKKNCNITDCRVLAYAYKHSVNSSNPLSCYIIKEKIRNESNV